ncbi:MAG: glycosyltransferase family 2 protein [Methanobrevibacter sp.]|uniref:glycosyltransferase family 2 protein n=1 Tax=Methanobrevibacter sp. TaxID=66852 RepID=UPI0025DC3EE4|nr:glycosyltransferase family A protein [Methanobrevibacter sp.]MBQ6099794.1 glycosyltransferase family 2 protein [Methanobrevibacter sp.]
MVEISVILPVYNSEDYLKECLDSILNQSFKDFEILCIDDGSSDGSLDILNEYKDKDERIIVVSQENIGVAKTRNETLNRVNGNYVYFMDSDDYLDSNTFKKLYANITSNESDFCIMKTIFVNGEEEYKFPAFELDKEFGKVNFNNFTFTYKDAKKHVLNDLFAPWLKFYRKDFLKSSDEFTFPEIKSYSDAPFHVKTMLNAEKISFVPEYLYYYRENDDSLVHSSSNTINFFKLSDIIEEYLRNNNFFDELQDEFYTFKTSKLVYYMGFTDSDEYYTKAKGDLAEINENFLNDSSRSMVPEKKDLDKVELILDSDNLKECKLALELYDCKRRVNSMLESRSWKVTKPLRKFMGR